MPNKGVVNNPSGKGGFGDNPQNKASGRWRVEDSIPYWQNYFLTLTVDDFLKWIINNKDKDKTVAQEIAYSSVMNAREDLQYLKEITDRTSGKSQQYIDHTTKGESIAPKIVFSNEQRPND